jgi:carboxypeptidase C (cathepsin A)
VKFPEFMTNEVWVSGESYGGVYTPYLAWQIYQNNLRAEWDSSYTKINLNGTMVGNGATNWDFDVFPSFPDTVFNFNMIPEEWLTTWKENKCYICFNDECGTNDDLS